ncbi:meiotic cohesin complex kleisin subunit Rec8 [Schizosaccharomyces pombe]|uniref:Meiotic recombination protein rec8 n=1 Tax=Schizosaccharomyces pombe (strain 972 / ATCC 24843) TaxID=284812 RepID=REC8_SCHPO|nr:meiotic cohesin complex subunit Rec8 [Schizosaccharomyces pombe]P36626.2 RecName: Full=Meiotic recombination protein rec8; AltName: Full=Cohesin rec8 [Schizosaccharomyces pombe 972h-]BAA33496.1 meiotic cohesin [Schizosaccharomyces pombe]CAA11240.1 cohesin [Schizosaccharomyces pombe]CAA22442.1 meiotic cohesin complex subunit Rec8 [Schizosaccharomyces pombe]|eukprot:NP_596059.1 meiotic cohesin complex subunit Rec8 [Schizosaccharomyces pombe]
MFYNQDVLTKEKGGMGVIWLAATLGSKHSLRKLHKKDIMSVDIDEACDFVAFSPEPLALRLSSNLMIGVTRVWAHQYSFFHSQVSTLHLRVRKELDHFTSKPFKNIDIQNEQTNPKQLLLAEDPAFIPEVSLYDAFNLPSVDLHVDMSSFTQPKENPNISVLETLPDSTSYLINTSQNYSLRNNVSSFVYEDSRAFSTEEPLDFEFDENGDIQELTKGTINSDPSLQAASQHSNLGSVQREYNSEEQESRIHMFEIDEDVLPLPVPLQSVMDSEHNENEPRALKRRKVQKLLEPDENIELSTRTLSQWRKNYVERMIALEATKYVRRRGASSAKKKELNKFFDWESFHPLLKPWIEKLKPSNNTPSEIDDVLRNIDTSEVEVGRDVQGELGLNIPWNTSSRSNSAINSKSHSQTGSEHSTPLLDTKYRKRLPHSPSMPSRVEFLPALESSQFHETLNSELSLQLSDDFVLYKNTQEENAHLMLSMEKECANFYEYAKTAIYENNGRITFSSLLPNDLKRPVVAQAFSHLLSLATKSAFLVKQDKPYSEISVSLNLKSTDAI